MAVESADKVEEESKTETPKVVNKEVVEEPQQKVYEEISEDITEEKTEEIHEDKETNSDARKIKPKKRMSLI